MEVPRNRFVERLYFGTCLTLRLIPLFVGWAGDQPGVAIALDQTRCPLTVPAPQSLKLPLAAFGTSAYFKVVKQYHESF